MEFVHANVKHNSKVILACMQTTDESMVPLLINCWPSASGGESYINIEYESTTDFDLQNGAIASPLPALAASPNVNQVNSCVVAACVVECHAHPFAVSTGIRVASSLPLFLEPESYLKPKVSNRLIVLQTALSLGTGM